MELPKRKPTRLREYDYSQNGAYFVTVCTQDKKCILGEVVPTGNGTENEVFVGRGACTCRNKTIPLWRNCRRSISLENIQHIADTLQIETYRLFVEEK